MGSKGEGEGGEGSRGAEGVGGGLDFFFFFCSSVSFLFSFWASLFNFCFHFFLLACLLFLAVEKGELARSRDSVMGDEQARRRARLEDSFRFGAA